MRDCIKFTLSMAMALVIPLLLSLSLREIHVSTTPSSLFSSGSSFPVKSIRVIGSTNLQNHSFASVSRVYFDPSSVEVELDENGVHRNRSLESSSSFPPVNLAIELDENGDNRNRSLENQETQTTPSYSFPVKLALTETFSVIFSIRIRSFYREYQILRFPITRFYFRHCFIQGHNASLLLDYQNRSTEKMLHCFDKIDSIKEEVVQQACPGNVSCADIQALGARNSTLLAGGPLTPTLNHSSSYEEALSTDHNPRTDDIIDNITCSLHLFKLRKTNESETVSLVDIGKIGKIGCDTIKQDPRMSIALDLLREMRKNCTGNKKKNTCPDKVVIMSKPKSKPKPKPKGNESRMAFLVCFVIAFLFAFHF